MTDVKPCPDCQTGWVYADDLLPPAYLDGLVPCPTCDGRGSVDVEDANQRFSSSQAVRAASKP